MTTTATRTPSKTSTRIAGLASLGALALALTVGANPAEAAFSGVYAPSQWTFENSPDDTLTDGSVDTTGAPDSITLIGGDEGSGTFGFTRYTTTAAANGTVSFSWNYTTEDDESFFDPFGFLLDGVFEEITDSNLELVQAESGIASFAVLAGQVFGFQINTDNTFGRAQVVISDFLAPLAVVTPPPNGVPEPGVLALLGLGFLGMRLARRQR